MENANKTTLNNMPPYKKHALSMGRVSLYLYGETKEINFSFQHMALDPGYCSKTHNSGMTGGGKPHPLSSILCSLPSIHSPRTTIHRIGPFSLFTGHFSLLPTPPTSFSFRETVCESPATFYQSHGYRFAWSRCLSAPASPEQNEYLHHFLTNQLQKSVEERVG